MLIQDLICTHMLRASAKALEKSAWEKEAKMCEIFLVSVIPTDKQAH